MHHIPNRVKELDGDGIVVPGEFGAADYLIQFASTAPGWIPTLRICRRRRRQDGLSDSP